MMTPKEVFAMAKENEVKVVDLRFLDFPGVWQHFTVPISELVLKMDSVSTDPVYGVGSRFMPVICWLYRMRTPPG